MSTVSLALAATSGDYIWTGGTCCGQNQPQFIHNPQALVNYFVSTPLPAGSPQATTFPSYTTCLSPPTALGQSCYVYAWYTNISYTSEANCPIDPLPELPKGDLCTDSLEQGAGVDVNKACPDLEPEMEKQAQCLANKISRLGLSVPYTGPGATVRTTAYQQHFVDVWKWKTKIDKDSPTWSDTEKQACAPIVAKVEAEMAKHKIVGKPSNSGDQAPHVQRKAIDIDEAVVDAMDAKVSETTFIVPLYCLFCPPGYPVYIGDVQDYVNNALLNPPPCNLRWGGRFRNYDGVHFDILKI